MHTRSMLAFALTAAAAAAGSTACRQNDPKPPVAETQTATPVQTGNQPMTVAGCLRAGEAADTFVLTTGGTDVATYALVPRENANLRDHVGHQVELSGVLVAQQQVGSRATAPAAGDPTGTSGTPQVSTRTTLNVREIEVNSVRRAGGECR